MILPTGLASGHTTPRLGVTVCAVLVAWLEGAVPAAGQSVWELTPYRIHVLLAMGRAPELTPALTEDLSRDLDNQVGTFIGAAWDVSIAPAPDDMRIVMMRGLESLTFELPSEASRESEEKKKKEERDEAERPRVDPWKKVLAQAAGGDKVILLTVRPQVTGYEVAARELDVHTRTLNGVVRVRVWQAARLRAAAFEALRGAFAPLAEITAVEGADVALRLRAGGFQPRDPSLAHVKPGDVFQTIVRHDDREGNPRRIFVTPWTFLSVDRVAQTELQCHLHTGLRTPLSGRRRGRVSQMALGVVTPGGPTKLTLRSRTDHERVLAGYDLYAQLPDSESTVHLGRTDRQGTVMIEPAARPLRLLLVRHGGAFLARLPLVPGMQPEVEATIPDDDLRLLAEAYITGVTQELVDLVTRRELLSLRIRALIEAGKYSEADELVREYRTLKTRDQLIRELTNQRKQYQPGPEQRDPAIERRINAMFDETQKLALQYLDDKAIIRLEREVQKGLSAKTAAGS